MDPDSPDSQTCVLSPETAGPGVQNRRHRKGPRAARPPPQRAPGSASLPPWGNGRPAAFPALTLLPGGHGSRSHAQDSADGFPAGPAASIRGAPGVPSVLLGLGSRKDGVRVEALCFVGVRRGYVCVRITKPTDWWPLWRGRPDGPTGCGDFCYHLYCNVGIQ